MRATWFCVDIECSGPVPHLYDMLSLGAVRVAATEDGQSFDIGPTFYSELAPTGAGWDEGAAKVHRLDRHRLAAEGVSRRVALQRLSTWVAEQTVPGTTPVFVGHNAPFDWSFVNYAYVAEGMENPFGYKALDTKALATGVLGVHWLDSNKELLEVELGLPSQDEQLVHRADYDAEYQALILVRLFERRPECVDS